MVNLKIIIIIINGVKSPRGDLPKSTTHTPHTHRSSHDVGSETVSTRNSLSDTRRTSVGGAYALLRLAAKTPHDTSFDNNRKGKRGREYPQPSFTLRRITGPTGRCSYAIRQKLAMLEYSRLMCADGQPVTVGKRGAAIVTFRSRQEASEGLGTPGGRAQELPERRWFTPHGCWLLIELRKKVHNDLCGRGYRGRFSVFPRGQAFFFCEKISPGVNSKVGRGS